MSAQLTANGTPAPCQSMTSYTNGAPNDLIYYYQAGQLGSLTATPPSGAPGWTFAWSKYNNGAWVNLITQNNLPSSTLNNLQQGAYRVTITDGNGNVVGCFRAWILQITQQPQVSINPITGDCDGPITLSATVQNPQVTPYNNLPPDPLIINAQTQITVCFSGEHSYVSDIGFLLKGPASCGTPTVTLFQNLDQVCNGGDNFNNLCFTTVPGNTLSICAPNAPTPLTGTYSAYNPAGPVTSTPINWAPLYGCDASSNGWQVIIDGWQVIIDDCTFGDDGQIYSGTVVCTGQNICGNQTTVTRNFGSATIFDQPNNAPCYYANAPEISSYPPINCTYGYQWSSNLSMVEQSAYRYSQCYIIIEHSNQHSYFTERWYYSMAKH